MIEYTAIGLNYELLEKGDALKSYDLLRLFRGQQAEAVEGIDLVSTPSPLSIESDAYRYALLALKEDIRSYRSDLAAHIREFDKGLLVMHDEEAERYSWALARKYAKGIGVVANRRGSIVHSQLTDQRRLEAEVHDRTLTAVALASRKELRRAAREVTLFGAKKDDEE